jgi:hypothetical protein
MAAAKLNEMSMIVLNWIREMDEEPGGTLREIAESAGVTEDPERLGQRMKEALMLFNLPFQAIAPAFLKDATAYCLEQVDWTGVARQRMAETA